MLLRIPDVLTPAQVAEGRRLLDPAAWTDGKLTAGHQAFQTKDNHQLPFDHPVARQLGQTILEALSRNALFMAAALPNRILPPMFNRYAGGQAFGTHVDSAIRQVPGTPHRVRTDISATLFFSEPSEYDGGELVIQDTYGVQRVKLPAGHMVLYPSTSLHQVTPVTRGARISSFFWIQSMVKEDGHRSLMFDLDVAIQRLGADHAGHPSLVSLTGVYHNLLRQWAEV